MSLLGQSYQRVNPFKLYYDMLTETYYPRMETAYQGWYDRVPEIWTFPHKPPDSDPAYDDYWNVTVRQRLRDYKTYADIHRDYYFSRLSSYKMVGLVESWYRGFFEFLRDGDLVLPTEDDPIWGEYGFVPFVTNNQWVHPSPMTPSWVYSFPTTGLGNITPGAFSFIKTFSNYFFNNTYGSIQRKWPIVDERIEDFLETITFQIESFYFNLPNVPQLVSTPYGPPPLPNPPPGDIELH